MTFGTTFPIAMYASQKYSKRDRYSYIRLLKAIPTVTIILIILVPSGDYGTLWTLIPIFGVVTYIAILVARLPKKLKSFQSWISLSIMFLGAFTYICAIPDRLAPGKYDLIGSGHQIMHICVALVIMSYSNIYRGQYFKNFYGNKLHELKIQKNEDLMLDNTFFINQI